MRGNLDKEDLRYWDMADFFSSTW